MAATKNREIPKDLRHKEGKIVTFSRFGLVQPWRGKEPEVALVSRQGGTLFWMLWLERRRG